MTENELQAYGWRKDHDGDVCWRDPWPPTIWHTFANATAIQTCRMIQPSEVMRDADYRKSCPRCARLAAAIRELIELIDETAGDVEPDELKHLSQDLQCEHSVHDDRCPVTTAKAALDDVGDVLSAGERTQVRQARFCFDNAYELELRQTGELLAIIDRLAPRKETT